MVVATKYKQGNKEGYYDIPGGKIEEGETPKQTAIREMREETGLKVENLSYKGNMIIEYPNRIFDFDVFLVTESEGEPQEFEDNISEWIEIQELLQKEKILSNIMVNVGYIIDDIKNKLYTTRVIPSVLKRMLIAVFVRKFFIIYE